jgi:hypothetical protein
MCDLGETRWEGRTDEILANILTGRKLFTTIQSYVSHKLVKISANVLHSSKKKTLKYPRVHCPADSGAAGTSTADEREMAVTQSTKCNVCIAVLGDIVNLLRTKRFLNTI